MVSRMEELFNLFNELSESQRKLVLETPTLLNAFCAEASEKIGVDVEVLRSHLNKLDALVNGEVDRVVRLTKSVEVVKDKGMQLIERQGERSQWYEDLVASPIAKALAVRELMDEGVGYDEAICQIESDSENLHLKKAEKRVSMSNDLSVYLMKPTLINWDDGTGQREREKKATIYHEILNLIRGKPNGLSKTEMLRGMRKDNSSWRLVCGGVLDYMVSRDILIRNNRKYYSASTYHGREHGYHRTIYELIVDSPQSKTSILKIMGYNNTKGRLKLTAALDKLCIEGLIENRNGMWGIP
jgi:hypothetical protein